MHERNLTVCYVPGLDLRRLRPADTPFLSSQLDDRPWAPVRTLPTHELAPTFLTGTFPSGHRLFQAGMDDEMRSNPEPRLRGWERLPDPAARVVQLIRHRVAGGYDLAVVPPWRRNRMVLRRFKFLSRPAAGRVRFLRSIEPLLRLGDRDSIFSLVGADRCAYYLTKDLRKLDAVLGAISASDRELTFLELYALDIFQHWRLDHPESVRGAYRRVDDFLRELTRTLATSGRDLVIFADHGQEPVAHAFDLEACLARLGLAREELTCLTEVTAARFWFHSERARREAPELLASTGCGRLFTHEEFAAFGFPADAFFGDAHLILDPGWIFFPHDFYHPLANLYMGLSDWQQRPRVRNPRHRGSHGHLPHHPSEQGLLLLPTGSWSLEREELELVDIAPTLLCMLGRDVPPWMGAGALAGA